MERRRVVITGLGAVTPVGLTAAESWQSVQNGVCGVAPITQFDPAGMKVTLAAEVKNFDPLEHMTRQEAKRMGRFTQFALVAAREALAQSGFAVSETEADRCGVIVSSGIGGLHITETEYERGKAKGWDRVSPFYIPTGICNMAAGQIAIDAGFRGMCSCPVTACAGETYAVGDAFRYIRDGYADAMLCGGTEAMAQVGAVAILTLPEYWGKLAYFGGIRNARFRSKVVPGDVVTLECRLVKRRGPVGIGEATAAVDGKAAASAELTFAIPQE